MWIVTSRSPSELLSYQHHSYPDGGSHSTALTSTIVNKIHIKNKYITNIISARKKYPHTSDGIFIDDKLKNIQLHIENNSKEGILFSFENRFSEYSHDLYNTCSSFKDILNYLNIHIDGKQFQKDKTKKVVKLKKIQ